MDTLARIKRLVIRRKVIFTKKAQLELEKDHLTRDLIYEAILNAPVIAKTLRSRHPTTGKRESLYVIIGITFTGMPIYTKGKLAKQNQEELFYVFISSKRSS